MSFTVTVPASTANLGPGYDTLGMALGLYDVVEVHTAGSGTHVEVLDAGAGMIGGSIDVPTDETHLVVRALRRACARLDVSPPGLRLRCHNAIPHARGLGSSSAAVVAGVAAGYALAARPLDDDAVQLAAEFDGHADNAAASLFGGLVIVWSDGTVFRAQRLCPHEHVRPMVAIPETRCSTAAARDLLPRYVPHTDAVFTAGRVALATHALTTCPALLCAATEDRLHQEYRAAAFPASTRLLHELRAREVAAVISGAGPTVLALTTDGTLPADVDRSGFQVRELPVDRCGARVEPL